MEFPGLGEHCSKEYCNRLDFLPVRCDSCKKIFCNEHFQYQSHGCDGERLRNVQVPTCPLCEAPVPGNRGEPPDIAVSEHIDNDCQADRAKKRRNKIFINRCTFKGCKTKELVPVECSECCMNFCFKHRHTVDHKCEGKISGVRKRLENAALKRMKENETQQRPPTNNVFNEIQGNMSEDEALAHAMALSLQEETNSNTGVNQQQYNRQRVGGEQNNGRSY